MKLSKRKKNARMAAHLNSESYLAECRKHPCRNCGEPGPHFVPPSLGEPGFFACEKRVDTTADGA